jgi:hypothetical protein
MILAKNPRGEDLTVDTGNKTTIVWATGASAVPPHTIMARARFATGDWGAPVAIGHGYAPQVAADGRGNLTAVWLTQRQGFTDGVATARRPAGGRWSDAVRLSDDLRVPGYPDNAEDPYGAAELDLAVSPDGAAVAAWSWGSDDRDQPWRIRAAYRPAAGRWNGQVGVTPASDARHPQVALDARGTVMLVYGRQSFGRPQVLKSRRLVDTGWTKAATIAPEGYGHQLTADRAGDALVVFTADHDQVKATYRPADGRWRPVRTLSTQGGERFAVAMNARGTAQVAVGRDDGAVELISRPRRGPWSMPVSVAHAQSDLFDVLVSLNNDGDTFVGWGGYGLYGKYRPHGGSWSSRSTISPATRVDVLEEASAVVAPHGGAAVLWKQEARPLKARWLSAP